MMMMMMMMMVSPVPMFLAYPEQKVKLLKSRVHGTCPRFLSPFYG
jgi:hypothetical protein